MSKRIKTHVNRDDVVEVISGAHKGKTGRVLQVLRTKDQVIVEGVRMIKKHEKRSQERPDGGIIEREGPIHISNVKLASVASSES
jgi:large subunit ribosomal protein L24